MVNIEALYKKYDKEIKKLEEKISEDKNIIKERENKIKEIKFSEEDEIDYLYSLIDGIIFREQRIKEEEQQIHTLERKIYLLNAIK